MANYAIQKVMNIRGYNVVTDEMELVLLGLKESVFSNSKEMSFVTKDNVKITSFDFGSSAQITGSSAYIQDDLLSAQLGKDTEIITTSTEIRETEKVTITTDSGVTKYVATGTADSEIKFAYLLNTDGTHEGTVLTQGAIASVGVFAYDTGTKTITTSGLDDGDRIEVAYYPTVSTAKKIENITTNYTKTLRLECDLLFKDVCTDILVRGKLVADKAKLGGNLELSLSEGGDPALQDFSAELLSDCEDNLWRIYIYSADDLS